MLAGIQLGGILVAVVSLVGLSNWLDDSNQDIIHVMMDAERGYQLQLAVLRERQEMLAWGMTTDRAHLQDSMALMDQANRLIDALEVHVVVDGEPEALSRTRQAMYAYREAELRAEFGAMVDQGTTDPTEVWALYQQTAASMETLLDATDELLTLYVDRAAEVQQEADRVNRATTVASPVVSVLLVGFTLLLLWRLMTLLGPLSGLQATMARLREGDLTARAVPVGVEELDNITSGINALASDLQVQRESRLAFFGAVAHDLRNPMNAMRLALQRVRVGRPLPREEDLRQMVTVMSRQLDLQARLVDDLLDHARLEAGEITLVRTEVALAKLCEGVVELLAPTAPNHQLVLDCEPVGVLGDGRRLEQMLVNLIGNAIKYSPAGGRVEIRVARRGDQVELEVTDEGMGIATADLPELFQPFRRSPRVSDIPGSGLGLSAVRRIVEAHGGTITVESVVGRGATFRIILPSAMRVDEPAVLTH